MYAYPDLKYVLKRARNDSPLCSWVIDSLHREAFAASSLTVGKYCPIVALQNSLKIDSHYFSKKNHIDKNHLNKSKPDVIVDLLSGGVLSVHPVKGEALGWIIGKGGVDHGAGVGACIHVDNFLENKTVFRL